MPSCGRGFDLFGMGRHILALAAIDDVDLAGAQAPGGAGSVDGDVTAADHGHPLAGTMRSGDSGIAASLQGHIAQEIGAGHDALLLLARDAQAAALVGADGQNDGVEAILIEQVGRS